MDTNKEKTKERIISKGKKLVEEDKPDVLILGCVSIGFLDIEDELEEAIGIPVINPVKTGLKLAESLLTSN